MERVGGGGVECPNGSRACDNGDSAEVFSVRSDGDVEGKDSDQDVSSVSRDEEEAVLGNHFWARGYCVSTIGLDEEKIKKYVQYQEEQERQEESQQQEFGF